MSQSQPQPQDPERIQRFLPVTNPQPTFWLQDALAGTDDGFHTHRTTPDLPPRTDILIIGAGYAGAAAAWHLARDNSASAKPSITVLEARGVCSGATGRNGGHLRPDLYGHIPTYISRAGVRAGADIARFEIAHVREMKKLIEDEKIDCDFTLARTVDVWCNPEAAARAAQVYKDMVAHRDETDYMHDVFFTADPTVAEGLSGVKGALASATYTAGTMWPYKFIAHLLKSLVGAGEINLQTHTPVLSVTPAEGGGFTVATERGTIHAGQVVHASNGYVAGLLPEYEKNIVPCKGICCHIAVPQGKTAPLLNNSYINRTEDLTLSYLIPRTDGSIVVGGASSLFRPHREQWYGNVDDSVLIESAKDYYDGYMQRTFRGWEDSGAKVDSIWTGVMGYSYDSNPHIGAVPGRPGQWILAGFNGHGMPVIWLGAKGLAKIVRDGVAFEDTGVPALFQTTQARIERAQNGLEEHGDILGDGSFGVKK